MSETSNVWIRSNTLELAITGAEKKRDVRGLPGSRDDDEECVDWGWAYADLISKDEKAVEVCIKDEDSPHNGVTTKIPADALAKGNIVMANKYSGDGTDEYDSDEDDINMYPDDLITLTHLHEPAVVHCLRKRYEFDQIYTATGPILLALNPFKNCKKLYSESIMKEYWDRGELSMTMGSGAMEDDKLKPHVYGIADTSFRTMMRHMNGDGAGGGTKPRGGAKAGGVLTAHDQSILVSGESGAGKTVTAKFIMQYLAKLSQRSANSSPSDSEAKKETNDETKKDGETKTVEQQVLQSNPILESFGNARTIRNDNSSRFGKFIEIKFAKTGTLVGASIETYLLEKVRLISQAPGERNYHIFYELFCCEDDQLAELHMGGYNVEDFNMTNKSDTYDRRDGVEDYETFDDLKNAMETMGLTAEEQSNILSVPSAVLHGSNVSFLAKSADESELDAENEHLEPFLKMMGLTSDALDKALCYLKIKAGKEFHTRTLPKSKAEKGMEALIKATYGALFTFLVRRINSSITVKDDKTSSRARRGGSTGAAAFIGVLDIFGFESFKHNSFEQLCINYCNEALQQQFNLFVLKNEQAEYEREGIEWSFISFPENQDVLDLIDKKGTGILRILDDQCRAPGTTDKTFFGDLYKKCLDHPRFECDALQKGAMKFGVNHYAGPVEYDTDGFVQKNRDELPKETTELLLSSEKEIIRNLASIISDPTGGGPTSPAAKKSVAGKAQGARVTVGGQFSRQLQDLRQKIDATSPHYIRCLKPNDILVPDHFDPLIISDQLRYAGVIEAVRVSRIGYPQRYTHNAFVARYKVLGSREMKKAAKATKKKKPVNVLVNAIAPRIWDIQRLQDAEADKTSEEEKKSSDGDETWSLVSVGVQVGKTKVFLRRRAYDILEQLRISRMGESAIEIQRIARGYIDQREYKLTQASILSIQCMVRMVIARGVVQEARRQYKATVIQSSWRKAVALGDYVALQCISRWMQRVQRGRVGRRRYEHLNRERKSIVIQKYWLAYNLSKLYKGKKKGAVVVQCAVRSYFARKELKKLRMGARDLGAAVEERDELRRETTKLRQQLKEAQELAKTATERAEGTASSSELSDAKAKVDEMSEEIQKLMSQLEESQQAEKKGAENVESITAALAEATASATSSKEECESLNEKLKNTQDELDKTKASLDSKEEEVKSLTEKLTELKNTTEEKETESTNEELENLQEQLARMEEKFNVAREEAIEASQRADVAESDIEGLRSELETLKESNSTVIPYENSEPTEEAVPVEGEEEEAAEKIQTVPSVELEKAQQQIAELKEQLEKALVVGESSRELAEAPESSGELAEAKAELEELKKKSAAEMVSATKLIEELKDELAKEKVTENGEIERNVPEPVINSDAAAEEILILQDEVARLNKELNEAKQGSNMDPSSPEMLAMRYDELRRLAEAGMEKDKEIEHLKHLVEEHGDAHSRMSDYTNHSEVDRLKTEIVDLRKELDSHKKNTSSSTPRNTSFLGRLIHIGEDSPEKDRKEVEKLKQVNETLRKDVVTSRKEIHELKFKLREEAERSAEELDAFAQTLRGVDELRQAAETMSRELSAYKRRDREQNANVKHSNEGAMALAEATQILDSARADFEDGGRQHSGKGSPFWNLGEIMNKPEEKQDQELQDLQYSKHLQKKKRKKKKRRGSGNSHITSFF